GTRLAYTAHDVFELLGPIRDARQDRRHANAHVDAGVDETAHRSQTLSRWRRARLGALPHLFVDRWDRDVHRDLRAARRFLEHVDVADDQRSTRDDAERIAMLGEGLDAATRQPVRALGRLVGIRGGPDGDGLAFPARPLELGPEHA